MFKLQMEALASRKNLRIFNLINLLEIYFQKILTISNWTLKAIYIN